MLRKWVQAQPVLTLVELQQALAERVGLYVGNGRLYEVLGHMGLSTPANAIPERMSSSNKPSRK